MKRISNLLLAVLVMVYISCDDAIDIIQPGELGADVAFQSTDDLQLGLNDVYFGLNTDEAIQISSFFTDETSLGIENSGQNIGLLQFILNSVSGIPDNLWGNNYATINSINRILEAAETISVEVGDQNRHDDILGQLYAIRAAEYFELLTYFSTDITDDSALGVIKLDFVPKTTDQLPRVSNGEIFDLIDSDLSLSKNLLDSIRISATLVTIDFVTALEARMALYRGNNSLADSKAQELIDGFPLANRAEYELLFDDANSTGLIFKGERNQSNDSGQIAENYYFRDASITGGAFMEVGRALFNQLDPADIRFDILVQDDSQIDPDYQLNGGSDDILLIGKYQGHDGQPLQNDYKYFRIAEMYLIKAEVQARENDLTGVASTLKILRDARFVSPTTLDVYASQNEALETVLNERRIELAFEGHRYIDLKRFNADIGLALDRDDVDCVQFNACALGADEFFKFTFPIPAREFAGNTEIREQQNPGYN